MLTQVHFSFPSYRRARALAVAGAAIILSGCWAPPSAGVRPEGKPRVVAGAIEVTRVVDSARIAAIDRAARTVVLSVRGVSLPACRIGRGVRNWDDLRRGDRVRATLKEILTLYVAPANESGPGAWARGLRPSARVLVADPSYRVLTLQYPGGETETFKVALHARMNGIEAGDAVAIRAAEASELRVRRPSNREAGSRSTPSAGSAR